MPEKLPSSAVGYDIRTDRVTTPDGAAVTTSTYSGPKAEVEALEAQLLASAAQLGIASLSYSELNGRATLTTALERVVISSDPGDDGSVQELYAVDVVRDIRTAPFFSTMTDAQVDAVTTARDNQQALDSGWTALQKALFGHLARGQDTYIDTAYEFRQTWRTTSTKQLAAASSNPNTVQPLPRLTATLKRLIDALPAGEWLKKPTIVQSNGRAGWTVTLIYQWAKEWSVIYGGSFTGL